VVKKLEKQHGKQKYGRYIKVPNRIPWSEKYNILVENWTRQKQQNIEFEDRDLETIQYETRGEERKFTIDYLLFLRRKRQDYWLKMRLTPI
jgi:hypothetical protein